MPSEKEAITSWPIPVDKPTVKTKKKKETNFQSSRHILAVSMIPLGNWNRNVRGVVARDAWVAIRYYLRATKDQPSYMQRLSLPSPNALLPLSCACCEAEKESLELHECWKYDDSSFTQTLVALIPICDQCHNVIHFGRASQLGKADAALAHLMAVNKLSKLKAREHVKEAYAIWEFRSQKTYSINLDLLRDFLPESRIHLGWLDRPKFWSGNRLDAIEWARNRLASSEAVIVDTETTGLISGPNRNERAEVIELAVLTMKGKLLYSSRFHPKYKIPRSTTDIHGLAIDDLKDCPTFAEEHPKILAVLAGKLAVSYNDKFDSGVIAKTSSMFKLEPPDCQWECAMRMYRAFIEGPRFVKLPGAKHGAVADCKATLRLIKAIANG